MKRLSIKTSLLAILLTVLLLFGLVAYFAISGLGATYKSTEEIATNWLPSVKASETIALNMANLRIAYRDHVIAQSDAEMTEREVTISKAEDALRNSIQEYFQLISSNRESELITAIKDSVSKYIAASPELLKLSRSNKTEEASKYMAGEMRSLSNTINTSVNALVEMNADGSKVAVGQSKATYRSVTIYLYEALACAMLLVIGAVAFVMTSIAAPITRITASMRGLAEGDVSSQIPFAGRADEIGTMAGAVEVFRQAAMANKRMELEAEEARQRAEADRIATQEKAEADAAKRLRVATSGLAAGLKRLATGDLAFQLTEAFAPDFEALRHDFNQSVNQLGTALATISESISTIDTGTREISSGANDLSKRTEQQAAALEETAAALDQITANVNSSTKRTEEARIVATQANDGATKSAEVVAHAVDAMRHIEEGSKQISNIIGVIDEIAFQTNLLALNAGVEAARAGEAGKGFAVVAQEVRELAQRSAQAAKEIKALIRNSSSEVESGVKLVRDAGEALQMIGGFIGQINDHMDAIATSAKEQSTGLAEVNSAVNSLDQTTQQNAAMVEESTAASSSLALEVGKLRELISQFRIHSGATSQSDILRQTATAMAQSVRPTAHNMPMPKRIKSNSITAAAAQDWEEF